jgi:hypothetical protein
VNEMMLFHLIGILRQARTKNTLSEVMGLLVYIDRMFLQILGGEEGTVKRSNVKKRTFSNWKMADTIPGVKILAMWSGLDDTRTVEKSRSSLKNDPEMVPELMVRLLEDLLKIASNTFKSPYTTSRTIRYSPS